MANHSFRNYEDAVHHQINNGGTLHDNRHSCPEWGDSQFTVHIPGKNSSSFCDVISDDPEYEVRVFDDMDYRGVYKYIEVSISRINVYENYYKVILESGNIISKILEFPNINEAVKYSFSLIDSIIEERKIKNNHDNTKNIA